MHQQTDHKYELFLQSLDETRTSMNVIEEKRLNGETLTYKDNKTISMRAEQHHHSRNQPINDQMKKRRHLPVW